MLERGSNNSLPAKYRIALALSTALLIHSLILSGIPSILPDPAVNHQQQLSLELVAQPPANTASASPDGATSSAEERVSHSQSFRIAPESSASKPAQPEISDAPANSSRQKKQQEHKAESGRPKIAPSASNAPQVTGADGQTTETNNTGDVTRITQSPSEQDPYLVKLATHLATRLETQRIPAIRELTESNTMELELQLLRNGALTRAKIIRSTGIEQIDRAAYRAALSASPYPEPPADQSGKRRFEVKLVFAPSRL